MNTELDKLIPLAIEWAKAESECVIKHGRALSARERSLAIEVGVAAPDTIRVMAVNSFPAPLEPRLKDAATSLGLLGPNIQGLTLGYAVLVHSEKISERLLSHEFRHVSQFEAQGSLDAFLAEYLYQIAAHGYRDAPLEVDARNHEINDASSISKSGIFQ